MLDVKFKKETSSTDTHCLQFPGDQPLTHTQNWVIFGIKLVSTTASITVGCVVDQERYPLFIYLAGAWTISLYRIIWNQSLYRLYFFFAVTGLGSMAKTTFLRLQCSDKTTITKSLLWLIKLIVWEDLKAIRNISKNFHENSNYLFLWAVSDCI